MINIVARFNDLYFLSDVDRFSKMANLSLVQKTPEPEKERGKKRIFRSRMNA